MTDRGDVVRFLTLSAVWGSAFVATKAALASIPPVPLAALRFDLASVLLFGLVLATGRRWRPVTRADWVTIATGGSFTIGAHHVLLFTGQQYVTSAAASILLGLVPVTTPVATRLLRPEVRPSIRELAGIAVGFLGVVLIADPRRGGFGTGLGVALVFGAAIAFVVGAVLTREDRATLPPLAVLAWMALVGAILLHAAALVLPGQSIAAATFTPESVGWLVYLATVPGAGGFLVYFRLLERLGPIRVSFLEYTIPPFAALFGWLVLGETLALPTVLGFLVILGAFLLVTGPAIRATLRGAGTFDR